MAVEGKATVEALVLLWWAEKCCCGSAVAELVRHAPCVLRQFQKRKTTVDTAVAMVVLVLLWRAEKRCCGSTVAVLVCTHRNEKNEDKNRVLPESSTNFLWSLPTVHNLPTASPIFLSAATGAYSLGIVVNAVHPPQFSGTLSFPAHNSALKGEEGYA